jgi:ankyrin repeat protein
VKSFADERSTSDGQTPLGLAIRLSSKSYPEDFTVIGKLLDAGCDPNSVVTTASYGEHAYCSQTALLEAIQTSNKDLVQLLINRGADVRAEAILTVKRSPIQKAVEVDSLEIITLLLELGADVNSKPAPRGGATALQMAAIRGNCNIAAKLFEYRAALNAPPAQINGRWPLEGAAEHGRLDMIEFLWKMNCGSLPKEQCRKAMELAEENGHIACRDLIAELSLTGVSSLPRLRLDLWPSFETRLDLM